MYVHASNALNAWKIATIYMQFLPWPLSIQTFTDESTGRPRVFASSNKHKNSIHFLVRDLPTISQPTEHNQIYTHVSRYFTTIPTVGPTVTSASRCGAASSGEKQPLKRKRRKSDLHRVWMLASKAFRDINVFSIEERARYKPWADTDDGKPTWSVSRRTTTSARRDDKVGNVARSELTSLLALALAAGYT